MIKWRRDQKGTRKLMCDSASPLKLRYLDVISYLQYLHNSMAGKMAWNRFSLFCLSLLSSQWLCLFSKRKTKS